MKNIIMSAALMFGVNAMSQDTTNHPQQTQEPLHFSGYVEAYYSYDFNKPASNNRPGFLYNYNRHNEFNLNFAFIRATYAEDRVRANLAVGVGTYMNSNYAAEPATLQNIYEANAGFKLSKMKNWWFDIGILPSHIGFESAVGKDNWTLTRSILAENSPYFQGGARLSYTSDNGKFLFAAYALNGWQRITRVQANTLINYGTQIFYKASDKITMNYSTFIGTDKPDSARLWRYFHNVYGIFQLSAKVGLTAGFDMGMEQKTVNDNDRNSWYSPVAIIRYTPNKYWAIALRGEYYSDENGVIIYTGTTHGFKTTGTSLNLDYRPKDNFLVRIEGRFLNSKDPIFNKGGFSKKENKAITFSSSIYF